MARDEPAKSFRELGVPRRAATAMSRLLRGNVTQTMCVLLPDVEYSSAPGTLILARSALIEVLPRLAADFVTGPTGVRGDWANSAVLPLILMEAMNYELISRARANPARAGAAAVQRPDP